MDTEKTLTMIRNNPYVIERLENPTEEMKLVAVETNGLALQYIKDASRAVQKAALANTPRAIQYIDQPTDEMLLQVVQAGWNNLDYIKNPSPALVEAALAQSGWAIKYIKDPDEKTQLEAVEKNFDAIKYIKNPAPAVQLAAVRSNYEALRYIKQPTTEAKDLAVSENEQAIRLIPGITKEEFLRYLSRNVLVSKYMPQGLSLTPDDWRDTFKTVLAKDDVDETYVRNFITCTAVDLTPADKVLLVDEYGSKKAKRITVDEKLTQQ